MKKILGALIFCVFVLSSCSGSVSVGDASLDQAEVEELILAGLTESAGVAPKAIDCEGVEDLEVAEGETFECTGETESGETFPVIMTLTDDEGKFTASVPG